PDVAGHLPRRRGARAPERGDGPRLDERVAGDGDSGLADRGRCPLNAGRRLPPPARRRGGAARRRRRPALGLQRAAPLPGLVTRSYGKTRRSRRGNPHETRGAAPMAATASARRLSEKSRPEPDPDATEGES